MVDIALMNYSVK